MLPVERHRFITEVLSQRGRVMVQEVAQLCHISIETARRDLALLERRGLLLRSHGGAVFVEPPAVEKTYVPAEIDQGESSASAATRRRSRRRASPNARWSLSRRGLPAAGQQLHQLVFGAPTAGYLAGGVDQLAAHHPDAGLQGQRAHHRTGGEYSAKYEDFIGVLAEQMLKEFVINKLFFSCHGICQDGGIRESNEHHARLKQQMLLASERKFLLVDSNKFGRRSFARICHYREIDTLITDRLSDDEFRQELAWNNVDVIEVSPAAKRAAR